MGKPTGFMDYKRETSVSEAPLERIRNFNEFHTPLSKEEQQIQGARCMNCGVPFCQAGMNIMGMTSGARYITLSRSGTILYTQGTGSRHTTV